MKRNNNRQPKYERKQNGKWNDPALSSMRETAFGSKAHFAIKDTMDRAERMRDDDALLKAAEEKRQRKLNKRLGAK